MTGERFSFAARIFLSTPSARRATRGHGSSIKIIQFLSTPSARRATRLSYRRWRLPCISIHALREEGDSPRLVRELPKSEFLSTPSARRATSGIPLASVLLMYFYPRPPRGGRPGFIFDLYNIFVISIHALREEGDSSISSPRMDSRKFLSTPSARRATVSVLVPPDIMAFLSTPSARRATPRHAVQKLAAEFLSTPSARRATILEDRPEGIFSISIHALREEGDQ